MNKFDWNCKTVDAYIKQGEEADVVYNVHWIVTGTSETLTPQGQPYSARSIGTQSLNTSDIADFTPFDQVTNEEVVAWTKAAMGEEQVAAIESNLDKQIESLVHPTSVTLTVGEPVPPASTDE